MLIKYIVTVAMLFVAHRLLCRGRIEHITNRRIIISTFSCYPISLEPRPGYVFTDAYIDGWNRFIVLEKNYNSRIRSVYSKHGKLISSKTLV